MQHDVLTFLDLLYAIDAHHQPFNPLIFFRWQSEGSTNDYRMTFHDRLDFAQVVRLQCGSGRDQVADQVGAPQARRDLDGPGERDDVCGNVTLAQVFLQKIGIGGCDALAANRARSFECDTLRNSERQTAASEIERANLLKARRVSTFA